MKFKFIILSVHDDESAIKECLEAGAIGYVLKRSSVNDLIPAIKAVLEGSTYISQSNLMKPEKETTR